MPPKDGLDLLDGTLYFEDESGELKPITVVHDVELTPDTDCEDLVPGLFSMQHEYHFGFDLDKWAYKMLVRMHQNNYRKLHGFRPIRRKVQRHKPEINVFTLKRIRGGFKFR